jgi:protein ImuB
MPVICALLPRFPLVAAAGAQQELLARPAALAPEPGAAQLIGGVSEPAERMGLRAGMRLGEALSRCPELALVPSDPERADRSWEKALRRLEAMGAEVEAERAGEAFFEAAGLLRLWGGTRGVLARVRCELYSWDVGVAAAPGRFCAHVAASRMESGARSTIVRAGAARSFLAPLPVSLLHGRLWDPRGGRREAPDADAEADDLPNELERLGIDALGRLAGLPRDAVADRFGRLGLRALRLARGEDEPLRPRRLDEALAVELELPEAVSGQQLERALEMLIARLLAHRERRGRAIRALRGLAPPGGAAQRGDGSGPVVCPPPPPAGPAAGSSRDPEARGGGARPGGRRAAGAGESRAGAAEAHLRGGTADTGGGGPRCGAAGAGGGSRLAGAGAPRRADAVYGGGMKGRLNRPWPVPVQIGADGAPRAVGRLAVESVREEWLVEDGWWTRRPLQRRYYELVLEDGSDVVVFCEPGSGRWYRQRD